MFGPSYLSSVGVDQYQLRKQMVNSECCPIRAIFTFIMNNFYLVCLEPSLQPMREQFRLNTSLSQSLYLDSNISTIIVIGRCLNDLFDQWETRMVNSNLSRATNNLLPWPMKYQLGRWLYLKPWTIFLIMGGQDYEPQPSLNQFKIYTSDLHHWRRLPFRETLPQLCHDTFI